MKKSTTQTGQMTTQAVSELSAKQIAVILFRINDRINSRLVSEIVGMLEKYRRIDLFEEDLLLQLIYKSVPSMGKTRRTGNVFADRLEYIDRNSFRLYMCDTDRNIECFSLKNADNEVKRAGGVRRSMAVHKDDHLCTPYLDLPSIFQLRCTVRRYDRFHRDERPQTAVIDESEMEAEASELACIVAAEIEREIPDEQMRYPLAEKLIGIVP